MGFRKISRDFPSVVPDASTVPSRNNKNGDGKGSSINDVMLRDKRRRGLANTTIRDRGRRGLAESGRHGLMREKGEPKCNLCYRIAILGGSRVCDELRHVEGPKNWEPA